MYRSSSIKMACDQNDLIVPHTVSSRTCWPVHGGHANATTRDRLCTASIEVPITLSNDAEFLSKQSIRRTEIQEVNTLQNNTQDIWISTRP